MQNWIWGESAHRNQGLKAGTRYRVQLGTVWGMGIRGGCRIWGTQNSGLTPMCSVGDAVGFVDPCRDCAFMLFFPASCGQYETSP